MVHHFCVAWSWRQTHDVIVGRVAAVRRTRRLHSAGPRVVCCHGTGLAGALAVPTVLAPVVELELVAGRGRGHPGCRSNDTKYSAWRRYWDDAYMVWPCPVGDDILKGYNGCCQRLPPTLPGQLVRRGMLPRDRHPAARRAVAIPPSCTQFGLVSMLRVL